MVLHPKSCPAANTPTLPHGPFRWTGAARDLKGLSHPPQPWVGGCSVCLKPKQRMCSSPFEPNLKCYTAPAVGTVLIFPPCTWEMSSWDETSPTFFFFSTQQAVILTISAHSHCCPVQIFPLSSLCAACKRAQMLARTVPACKGTCHLSHPWGGRYRNLQIWGGFSKDVGLLGKVPVGDSQWLDAG